MKTIIVAALLALSLSACDKIEAGAVEAQTGRVVDSVSYGDEVCYRGVVYVNFNVGQSSWGGAKFTPDGKVALCNKSTN